MTQKPTYKELEDRVKELKNVAGQLREAQKEIQELKDFKDVILQNKSLLISLVDEGGHFSYASESFSYFLGYSPEDLMGMHWGDIIISREPGLFETATTPIKAPETDVAKAWKVELRHKSGRKRPVLLSHQPVFKGKRLEGWLNVVISMDSYWRAEAVMSTLYDISKAVSSTKNLDELFISIHQSIGKIINAQDFSISLYDKDKDILKIAYHKKGEQHDLNTFINASKVSNLTAQVIRSQKPVLLDEEEIARIYQKTPLTAPDHYPKSWMGVPLLIDNNMIGVAAIRDYMDADSYTPEDVEFLASVSDQIAIAIERKRAEEGLQKAHEKLEQRVRERTKELEEANIKLRKEIQEREKAQEVLRLSEEKFSKAFQSNPTLMSISTLEDGTFIDVNDSFLKAHAFRREEVIGRTSIELGIISPEDRKTLSNIVEKGPFHRLELDLYTKTGGRIHGSFSADIINIEGRQCVLAAVDDISEQKKAEKALKESEERYRAIFENSPIGISLTSKEGRFITVNQAIADMGGFTIDELLKLPLSDLYQDPEKRKPLLEAIERDGMVFNYPVQFKRKDGTIADALLTMTKVPRSGGEEVYQSICIDITSQIKAEQERKELEARLNQVKQMDAIATLAGGIAHQFNNALFTINGNLELLNMDMPDDEKINRYIEAMKDSVYRMAHLNDQLLAYARGGKYRPEIIGLNDFIRDTLPLIKHTIQSFVYLETDLPNNILGIKADLTQMQMILSAILSNASEAIEKKGRILISCRNETVTEDDRDLSPEIKPGIYVHLTIEDDGKGMHEKTKSRIFEPFFSTKLHGRGLGMAAVYGIIKNHDGYIKVDSEEGKGTKVHIYLPAVDVQQRNEKKQKPDKRFEKESGTILLIEDEENVMEVNHAMLERLGYRVLKAMSGKQAVDLIKMFDEHIDLAILDIILPDMDGMTIYHIMKEYRPNMKVILCSGYSCDGPAREILDAGAQVFIQKPFSMRRLAEKIKGVLKK